LENEAHGDSKRSAGAVIFSRVPGLLPLRGDARLFHVGRLSMFPF